MVRSMTAATATARPVLTTSPPDPDAPSFAGVEHPFLSLRGRTAFSVIARPRSGRSNLLAWGSPRPFGARDDRKVSHCEARSLSVIARPRSGRSNLILTQDDSIGPLATLGTTLMLKFGPFQHDGKNVLRLYSHQQEPHRSVHGDHKRPFKAHVGTPGGFGLEIRGPVPCDRTCVFRGF